MTEQIIPLEFGILMSKSGFRVLESRLEGFRCATQLLHRFILFYSATVSSISSSLYWISCRMLENGDA